jgi:stress response protein SCP2
VRYLDGAVLLFGPNRSFLEMVAWNNQHSSKTAVAGAVKHSGDIMQFDQQAGKNLATIQLSRLGEQVSEAFVTLSAWSDAMLSDIVQPYVQLFEPSTRAELCQVHLDSAELATKRSHKCVIITRVYREARGGWGVQGVGAFCQGNTGSAGGGYIGIDGDPEGVAGMVAGIRALRS